MAIESVAITEGSGKDIAVDTIDSKEYQVIKIALGADGAMDNLIDAGQQLMAASLPVVLASNHGDIKMTLDGETVTLAGNLPDTAAGDLAAIVAALGGTLTVDATGQGDVPVTLDGESVAVASIAAGDNNIGNVDIASALPAGTNNIGDVDVLSLPGAVQGPGDPIIDSYASAVVDLAASTANQSLIAAPGENKQIWVYGLFMMADTAAGTVTLQDEDDTALSGTMAVSDEGGWVLPMSGNFAMPWLKVATNKALEADTGACTVDGIITYAVVSV